MAKSHILIYTFYLYHIFRIRERSRMVQMQGGNEVDYPVMRYQRVVNAADAPLPGGVLKKTKECVVEAVTQ